MFKSDKNMTCGYAQLNVQDLTAMKKYYTENIGLGIIKENEKQTELGIVETGSTLLLLSKIQKDGNRSKIPKAGLFHMAFLLPSRKDLGNILYSLLTKGVTVSGASDHGYSEAIYLQDPEGNGIEIYWDMPKENWIINEDGTIPGVTEEMDAEGVLSSRNSDPSDKLPEGTIIGHMHLSVSDLTDSSLFYTNVLGLSVKYNYGQQAQFLAAGAYHHHLGMNTWAGKDLPRRDSQDLGLTLFSVCLQSEIAYHTLQEHLNESDYTVQTEQNHMIVTDPNGIHIKIEYINK